MSATILVTGATGMAGRFIIPALQSAGFCVRGQFNRQPGTLAGVDWRQADFLANPDLPRLVDGCEAIVHLAAALSDQAQMDAVNVAATRALLAAAGPAGVRYFGYASSIVVYGSPRQRAVDETTPLIDVTKPIGRQYHAEPYMLDYARTKVLAEQAINDLPSSCAVDLYRPAVVADDARLVEVLGWSAARKLGAAYRCTQYIYASDAAAAIGHLVTLGMAREKNAQRIQAFNICDNDCGTFRDVLRAAYAMSGDPRHKLLLDLPVVLDLANDLLKYRNPSLRYPLGMLKFSNARLLATGFKFPTGMKAAQARALRQAVAGA